MLVELDAGARKVRPCSRNMPSVGTPRERSTARCPDALGTLRTEMVVIIDSLGGGDEQLLRVDLYGESQGTDPPGLLFARRLRLGVRDVSRPSFDSANTGSAREQKNARRRGWRAHSGSARSRLPRFLGRRLTPEHRSR